MICYLVTGLYRAYLWFNIALKTVMDWAEDNQYYLSHPNLPTIPVPPFVLPVHQSCLWSTQLHIVP